MSSRTPPDRTGAAVAIRPAEPDDLPDLVRLHAESFSDPWSAEALRELLADHLDFTFVAPGENKRLNGFLLARRIGDEAEILTLAVEPPCRRTGIARHLLARIVAQLQRVPPCRLFLEVSAENRAAIGLYGAAGFRQVGLRKGYYPVPGCSPVDAMTMALDIQAHAFDL